MKKLEKYMSKRNTYILGVVLFVIFGVVPSFYFYSQYQKSQALLKDPALAAKEEGKQLIIRIGKLIELPKGENPTIATVSDINKLKDQVFFAQAKNGDKVLIYGNAKKAILYRSSINKLINVGPININNVEEPAVNAKITAPSATPTPTPSPAPVKVVLWNGTATIGLTNTAEKLLKDKASYVQVVDKDNAKKKYDETLVIDLSGGKKDAAANLAKLVNGKVGVLPEGEEKPKDAEILIILGKNYK